MYLTCHKLLNYRNISEAVFNPIAEVNVICGNNGHGKTNLLESIFLLTGARSFRIGKDIALINKQSDFSVIDSYFFSEGRTQSIKMKIVEKGRIASLNKGTEKKAAGIAGSFCCVVFSPEHLELVKGSPEIRRKFIDTAMCQISPGYLANLKKYTRLVNQRNRLLKDCAYVSAASEMLDVYDVQFIQAACAITEQRITFINELIPIAEQNYTAISNGREQLFFSYESTLFHEQGVDFENGLERLRAQRAIEQRCGFTTVGPHRDDIEIYLSGEEARIFASQGQQRCIVLSLKLGEAELMERRLGERPVLLLDDVLSELDSDRQDYLIENIKNSQAIITCCEPELVINRAAACVFKMENGVLNSEFQRLPKV